MRPLLLFLALLLVGCVPQAWRNKAPSITKDVAVRIPRFQQSRYPNGVSLYLHPDDYLPLVSVQLVLRPGSALPSLDESAALDLLYELMAQGNSELLAELDAVATGPVLERKVEGASFEFSVPPIHLPAALSLLSRLLREPVFDPQTFSRVQAQRIARLFVGSNRNLSQTHVFRDVAIGSQPLFIEATDRRLLTPLSRLTLDDMKATYDRYIGPGNVAVVIAGPVAPIVAGALVKKYFAGWSKELPASASAIPLAQRPRKEILILPRPKLPAVVFTFGQLITDPVNESQLRLAASLLVFRATQLFALVSGSEPAMPFLEKVTTSRHGSLVKVIGVVPGNSLRAALSALDMAVSLDHKAEVAVLLRAGNHLQILFSSAVDLPWIRLEHVWKLMDAFNAPQKTSAEAARLFLRELPNNHYETQLSALQAVSLENLTDLLRRQIAPDKAHIVLEGDPEIIRAQLERSALGPVRVLDE